MKATRTYKVVVLITPGVLVSQLEFLKANTQWDTLIVDEGHKAKNVNTKFRRAVKELPVRVHKVVLTGTPV